MHSTLCSTFEASSLISRYILTSLNDLALVIEFFKLISQDGRTSRNLTIHAGIITLQRDAHNGHLQLHLQLEFCRDSSKCILRFRLYSRAHLSIHSSRTNLKPLERLVHIDVCFFLSPHDLITNPSQIGAFHMACWGLPS